MTHGGDWKSFQDRAGILPLDFSASISPLGLPTTVRQAVTESMAEADRYPDPLCRALRYALSERTGVPVGQIVCGNGAADLIFRIVQCVQPKRALLFAPCFSEYENALRAVGADIVFCLEEDQLLEHAAQNIDIAFLCQPNNPTGLLFSLSVLEVVMKRCRMLVLDECFLDFVENGDAFSMLPWLGQESSLVLLRAFTKTYAMAGLRLGYALCGNSLFAQKLQASGQPWAVSVLAQAAGLAALGDNDYLLQLKALIRSERPRLMHALQEMGFTVLPGQANFLLFHSEHLLNPPGILLRDCSDFRGLGSGWYRVAVRTAEDNSRLIQALKELV